MDIREVKEESSLLDFSSQNERYFMKDSVRKVKIETVSSSDIKPELEDSTYSQNEDSISSENEEHNLLKFNETINESEIEPKIDVKEEDRWLGREDLCINDDIKNEPAEDVYSTKPSLYEEDVSSCASNLFSTEDLENGISFHMNNDGPECKSGIKFQGQDGVVSDVSSIDTSVYSETCDHGKSESMVSSLEQSKLLEHNTNKQDINNRNSKSALSYQHRKSHKCDVSKKCLKCSSHLKTCRLVLDSKKVYMHEVFNKGLNQLSLKSHQLTDERKKPHNCNICSKKFTRLQHLKTHQLIHEGIKPHKCVICNKAFTHLSDLKRHKLIHEGIKAHQCKVCNKAFTQLSDLKRHKVIHDGIKPHNCDICNKGFTRSSSLVSHKLIHEGLQPHKCKICNKPFTVLLSLKKHKLVHEAIKPYKCNICDKEFTESSSMKIHKLLHEGIKTHKCDICNKSFTSLSHLKRHKLLHEGTRPHKCNICNKGFADVSGLKTHVLTHQNK